MKILGLLICFLICWSMPAQGADRPDVSDATAGCLDCHETATPALVADWLKSRHARTSPAQALKVEKTARRVSAAAIPDELAGKVVGCAECHAVNSGAHPDEFDHEGTQVHTVVTPRDCAVCHPVEAREYDENKMARAYGNLRDNPLFMDLARTSAGDFTYENHTLASRPPDSETEAETCFYCHGTKIEVGEMVSKTTEFGDLEFPTLKGWPNMGAGRINPDQSRGSCAVCHTRHHFSLKTARNPYTCSQCHKGPDVPAYKIYSVSKHGNIHASHKDEWDFEAVPWTAGRDFTAPTCAVCHISLLTDPAGNVIAARSHRMEDRLPWRLFGLIYSHPQPRDPDTSKILNAAGLPLPTDLLTGRPASAYLIDDKTREERAGNMRRVCQACHVGTWVESQWKRFEGSLAKTDAQVLAATQILAEAWREKAAQGPPQGSPFDEAIEKKWVETWLFYANSTRLASAMSGADYGVFEQGRFFMSKSMADMVDWLETWRKTAK
ncbi:MAG: multiheme c-type cytochrome [Pseudomonadota bacterium]